MLAQTWPDFGLAEWTFSIVRIIATIGGALVGWFLAGPLTRVAHRIATRKATPGWLLACTKPAGAAALALLIYFFMPLGGGPGGWGWGPGLGSGPGKGPGEGGKAALVEGATKDVKKTPAEKRASTTTTQERRTIDIEILGGARFPDDGKNRYYLRKGVEPSSLEELHGYFEKNSAKIEVRIIRTLDSASFGSSAEDPTRRLRELANKMGIPTITVDPQ